MPARAISLATKWVLQGLVALSRKHPAQVINRASKVALEADQFRLCALRSTIMTSNRPLEDWGKLIGGVPTAGAILDRFLSRAEIIQIVGKSYRLRNKAIEQKSEDGKENNK